MKRFDFYANPDGAGYFLIVQSHRIDIRKTRVVVPLLPKSKIPFATDRLHPIFRINDQDFVMATHLLAAISVTELTHHIGSLADNAGEIMNALDMLLTGV